MCYITCYKSKCYQHILEMAAEADSTIISLDIDECKLHLNVPASFNFMYMYVTQCL